MFTKDRQMRYLYTRRQVRRNFLSQCVNGAFGRKEPGSCSIPRSSFVRRNRHGNEKWERGAWTRVQGWMLCLLERTDVKSAASPPRRRRTYKDPEKDSKASFSRALSAWRASKELIYPSRDNWPTPELPRSERRSTGVRRKEVFSLPPKNSVP